MNHDSSATMKICAALISVFFLIALSAALQPETDESIGFIDIKDAGIPLPVETDDDAASARARFRPVNRRFPDRIRQPHRRRHSKGIFYVSDMLIPSGENSDFADPMPPRWGKLHRRYHAADDGFGIEKKPKFTRKQFRYHHNKEEQHTQDGFMDTVRKLFNKNF